MVGSQLYDSVTALKVEVSFTLELVHHGTRHRSLLLEIAFYYYSFGVVHFVSMNYVTF